VRSACLACFFLRIAPLLHCDLYPALDSSQPPTSMLTLRELSQKLPSFHSFTLTDCRAMDQAGSCRPLAPETRVRSQASPWGNISTESGSGKGVSVFIVSNISHVVHNHSFLILFLSGQAKLGNIAVKVKVNVTLEQATKAQRGSRGIAVLFP
jgi:hypothetical protein